MLPTKKNKKILFTTQIRSLMIYYLRPQLAAGLIDLNKIDHLENQFTKNFVRIPNDVRSEFLQKNTSW